MSDVTEVVCGGLWSVVVCAVYRIRQSLCLGLCLASWLYLSTSVGGRFLVSAFRAVWFSAGRDHTKKEGNRRVIVEYRTLRVRRWFVVVYGGLLCSLSPLSQLSHLPVERNNNHSGYSIHLDHNVPITGPLSTKVYPTAVHCTVLHKPLVD